MSNRLVVCERCQRHVKRGEAACPFCSAPRPAARLGLGAAVILGAGLSVGGCGTGSDLGDEDSGVSVDGSSDGGRTDSGARDGQAADAWVDSGSVNLYGPVPAYGLPPPDAGAADAGIVYLYAAVPTSVPNID